MAVAAGLLAGVDIMSFANIADDEVATVGLVDGADGVGVGVRLALALGSLMMK